MIIQAPEEAEGKAATESEDGPIGADPAFAKAAEATPHGASVQVDSFASYAPSGNRDRVPETSETGNVRHPGAASGRASEGN